MKPSAALLFSAQGLVASIWDLIGGNSLFFESSIIHSAIGDIFSRETTGWI